MAETAPHAHCHWPSWCAEAAGTALMVLPSCSPPPWTGASLTPARSGGPAPAFGDVSDLWIYFATPCAAALVVGLLWRFACNARRAAGTNP